MTLLTSWIGFASFATSLALIVHSLASRSFTGHECLKPNWWSLSIRFALESTALSVWLACGLPLLGWMFWFGDNEHWFWYHGWIIGVIISVSATGIATARISKTGATLRYLRLHYWTSLALIVSFGAVYGYESLRSVEAATPELASRRIFARLAPFIDEPVSYVEHVGPLPHGFDADLCKSYWIMGANEPRGRFSICHHKWYGWKYVHSEIYPPSVDELKRARQWLAESTNRYEVISILRNVITNYPDSPAETEAKELLKSIGEPVPLL